jgi:hypothetical protein
MSRANAAVAAGYRCGVPSREPKPGSGWYAHAGALAFVLVYVLGARSFAAGPRAAVRLDVPIVVTQVPAGSAAERSGPRCGGMLRADYGDGARLVVVAPDGAVRVVSAGFQSACEADVSWDGQRLLFAGKKTAGDTWNVFEIGVDGKGLRQVTHDLGECRSPRYLSSFYTITEDEPWDQVAFVVTRAEQRNEQGGGPPTSLTTCKLDGSFVQRITYNLSNDFDPLLTRDGRLLHATWHLATFDRGVLGRVALEGINVDGSDRAAFVGPVGKRVQQMPCATATEGGLTVFVESDALPWDGSGTLGQVSLRRPLHSYRPLTTPADGLFHSPSALPDGRILVSRRPADGTGTLGVFRMDPATRAIEPVFDDPAFHDMHARAVVARTRADGRSSVVSGLDSRAGLYCLGVDTTDLPGRALLPRGTAKTVRVIEGLPEPAGAGPRTVGAIPALSNRRVLAEVPLKADGSFHVNVPANTPVQLQILDGHGLALRSCGWIWARNHQEQGCIGCHEDPERTPDNLVPEALNDPPVGVAVKASTARPVDFRRDVAPIVEARCLACHGPGGSEPRLGEGPLAGKPGAARSNYEALMAAAGEGSAESGLGRYVHPGRARTSPLIWHVVGRNTARHWDGAASLRTVRQIPAGAPAALTEAEVQVLIRWIDLGAAWDGRTSDTNTSRPR